MVLHESFKYFYVLIHKDNNYINQRKTKKNRRKFVIKNFASSKLNKNLCKLSLIWQCSLVFYDNYEI